MILFVIAMQRAQMHLLIFVSIYISSLAVWRFSHSLDYKMIELTEMKLIAQIVTQFTYSQITGDISTATRLYWKIVVSATKSGHCTSLVI